MTLIGHYTFRRTSQDMKTAPTWTACESCISPLCLNTITVASVLFPYLVGPLVGLGRTISPVYCTIMDLVVACTELSPILGPRRKILRLRVVTRCETPPLHWMCDAGTCFTNCLVWKIFLDCSFAVVIVSNTTTRRQLKQIVLLALLFFQWVIIQLLISSGNFACTRKKLDNTFFSKHADNTFCSYCDPNYGQNRTEDWSCDHLNRSKSHSFRCGRQATNVLGNLGSSWVQKKTHERLEMANCLQIVCSMSIQLVVGSNIPLLSKLPKLFFFILFFQMSTCNSLLRTHADQTKDPGSAPNNVWQLVAHIWTAFGFFFSKCIAQMKYWTRLRPLILSKTQSVAVPYTRTCEGTDRQTGTWNCRNVHTFTFACKWLLNRVTTNSTGSIQTEHHRNNHVRNTSVMCVSTSMVRIYRKSLSLTAPYLTWRRLLADEALELSPLSLDNHNVTVCRTASRLQPELSGGTLKQ